MPSWKDKFNKFLDDVNDLNDDEFSDDVEPELIEVPQEDIGEFMKFLEELGFQAPTEPDEIDITVETLRKSGKCVIFDDSIH